MALGSTVNRIHTKDTLIQIPQVHIWEKTRPCGQRHSYFLPYVVIDMPLWGTPRLLSPIYGQRQVPTGNAMTTFSHIWGETRSYGQYHANRLPNM